VPTKPVEFGCDSIELQPSPIDPSWIIDGEPLARNAIVSRSEDQTACTIVWDCTAGRFNWYYDFDETVHIREGSVVVDDGHNPPKRLGPGDIVLFPAGSHAVWHVEDYVRKVAFCRKVLPRPLGTLVRLVRGAKIRLSRKVGPSLMAAGSALGAG
jgi:uncharacterized protein